MGSKLECYQDGLRADRALRGLRLEVQSAFRELVQLETKACHRRTWDALAVAIRQQAEALDELLENGTPGRKGDL
jgi:hypothetical protein